MVKGISYVGLDVHKEKIAVAIARTDDTVESLGSIDNNETSVRRLIKQLGPIKSLRVVYEAGPCGYALYRFLVTMGVACQVIAPALVPQKPADRVKTDRRDALKLARAARSGDLTAVRIPTELEEAFRDLVRAREAAVKDLGRARHRVQKLLLRQGVRPADPKMRAWTQRYWAWVVSVKFKDPAQQAVLEDGRAEIDRQLDRTERFERLINEQILRLDAVTRDTIAALQALRGIKTLAAATIVSEMGSAARFAGAPLVMSYAGITPTEYSTGGNSRRGAITKCGNAHLRRIIVEAAWMYLRKPGPSKVLKARRASLPPEVVTIATKAEQRLHSRYYHLLLRGKPPTKAVVAVARELLGFIWAIGMHIEQKHARANKRAA